MSTQLLLQEEALAAVIVLHTHVSYAPVAQALPALQTFFAAQTDWPALQTVLIPVDDVLEPAQLDQFANTLYSVLKQWIAVPSRVHLLLAGGRKPMAMLGMIASGISIRMRRCASQTV